MILWDSGKECEEARVYYYDRRDGSFQDEIPQTIQTHIQDCAHCRQEVLRLDQALKSASTSDSQEASRVATINTLLEMHFKHMEEPVTCAMTKRFLPSMASHRIKINIPTPVTVHIERCPRCRTDWLELQSLNLPDVQLQNLTQCLEHKMFDSGLTLHAHLTDSKEYWIYPPNRAIIREGQTWKDYDMTTGLVKTFVGTSEPTEDVLGPELRSSLNAARRKKGPSKPDRVLRQAPRIEPVGFHTVPDRPCRS